MIPLKLPIITNPINRNSIFVRTKKTIYPSTAELQYNEKGLLSLCARAENVPSSPRPVRHSPREPAKEVNGAIRFIGLCRTFINGPNV
jgi:hypothetical protein